MNTRNKALIITGIAALVIALAAFLIGGAVAGWDFAAFFRSQTFLWICIFVAIYFIVAGAIIIKELIDKRL